MQKVDKQTIRAVTPLSVLVKLVEFLDKGDGVDLDHLFDLTYCLARDRGIYLYDFHIDYEGNITSSGFWKDITRMISWGYAQKASPNIKLTDAGKEFAGWLILDAPIEAALSKISCNP